MNRKILFGGLAALILLLTLVTGAGVALAAMAGDALTATGVTADTTTDVTTAPDETAAPEPTTTPAPAGTDPSGDATWSPPSADRTPQAPVHLAPGASPSVSDDEIRAWTGSAPFANDDPQNTAGWTREIILEVHCMAGKGWDYDPLHGGLAGVSPTTAEYLALYGDTGVGDAYRWQDAGCAGYAVHATGNDGGN